MYSRCCSLIAALLMLGVCPATAEDDFDSLVVNLADDRHDVRLDAQQALIKLCREEPQKLDGLAPVIFDPDEDIERVFRAKEVVSEVVFVERGVIGFALGPSLRVQRIAEEGPAQQVGIQLGWRLIEMAGKSVEGKDAGEVYASIHGARPGTVLEMVFRDADDKRVVVRPTVAPRSAVRSDENVEQRRKDLFAEWMERKGKEFASD